jgi:hypothetical protein
MYNTNRQLHYVYFYGFFLFIFYINKITTMASADYLDLLKYLKPKSRCLMKANDYDSIIWLTPDIQQPTKEECDAVRESFVADLPMLLLRGERDMKLAECDYVVAADYTMPEEKKAEWVIYRQALRDFPANVSPAPVASEYRVLTNVTWPTPPSN